METMIPVIKAVKNSSTCPPNKRAKKADNKVFVYNNNSIYLLHNNKSDKIFEETDRFEDIRVDGNNIYILFKNKLIKGQIK
jgi:hypothetical protein